MKKLCALGILLILFSFACVPCFAAGHGFVSLKGAEIAAPGGSPLLLKGISLGNWLLPEGYMLKFEEISSPRLLNDLLCELVGPGEARRFWKDYRAAYISKKDIMLIRKLGFNMIRVPFNYRLFTPEDHPGIWLDEGFTLLDQVVSWAQEAGLMVILDMHGAPGGQTGENIDDGWGTPWLFESPECQERTIALWKKLAERYKASRTVIGYELLNEPVPDFEGYGRYEASLEPLYRRITEAIRTVDRDHLIILGGSRWCTNFECFGKPFDSKLVYTFHHYWADPSEKSLQKALAFREKYGVPLWMGESGENTDQWIEAYRKSLEKHRIGWSFWPYKKMDSPSCVATFPKPRVWEELVSYAEKYRGASWKERRLHRPSPQMCRKALDELLEKAKVEHCIINRGFLKALGLEEPAGQ
ncbi:MAG: glycoside hydrolase family 5 protein [Candidatus Eremiobacteraeota bacterium]|nr:glycoside hydrolase family 5 protein [Candidatus Eremiobacteraeota bacterium]